ncbi:MAG: DNA topoisomerase IV subunit A [Candidatus Delongbacteria bacterium]|nr:DNA topoisomerase IV subunit A [Candidatus Delongbacteria bacterium]
MSNLKKLLDSNFLEYANYVVKERAIPDIKDGLKPVQRRVLYSMFRMDDGRFNKVANIVGHTMQFHPHGDSSIGDALVGLGSKDLFIETQGNFGNIITGDNAAAARYIEARLTPLAKEVLFNKDITEYTDSYDRRNMEPVAFPAKIPVALLLGVEGIAVGMSTKILPHNFNEVLQAQIDYLEGKEFRLYPDFIQGGMIDVSEYGDGNGKIRVRAVIDAPTDKKLIIREIPYGTTTESLIASIEKASKSGKIKVASINDYTTSEVEIEINLARGYTSEDAISALYAFSDCEKSISASLLLIRNKVPVVVSVTDVIKETTDNLVGYLKRELEIKLERLNEKFHARTLMQIFIENRIYKKIEELNNYTMILNTVKDSFIPFEAELVREVTYDDVEKLLQLPIKHISRFDINKNKKELNEIIRSIKAVKKDLGRIKDFTVDYIGSLIEKYGEKYQRRTKIESLETILAKDAAIENIKLYYDRSNGYLGTNLKSEEYIMVSEFSHVLLMFKNGTHRVVKPHSKEFIGKGLQYFDTTNHLNGAVFSIIYRDKKTGYSYVKRFDEIKYILDKDYRYYPDGCKLDYFTKRTDLHFTCDLEPGRRTRNLQVEFDLSDYKIKGLSAKGVRITNKNIVKIKAERTENNEPEANGEVSEPVVVKKDPDLFDELEVKQ